MDLRTLKVLRFFHLINKKEYNEKRQIELVKASPLFDAKWYLEQNPDVKAKKIGAARHYVKWGWKEGRNPGKAFDTKAYLEQYPELLEKNWCPLFHYMLEHKELILPIDWHEVWKKYFGYFYKLYEAYTFKYGKYKGKNQNYILIARSKYFDKRWYLKMYPDVKKAGVDPVKHYMQFGWKEGRHPGPKFDGNVYLDLNADVKRAKINPLLHYEKYGKKEGRKFNITQNVSLSLRRNFTFDVYKVSSGNLYKFGHIVKNQPYFSIIMPTYNRDFCIQNAIQSLLHQTYKNFELIIVDDGSTDNTKSLIHTMFNFELESGKIKYIYKENSGVCKTRNIGLSHAHNEWIGYLDSDNILLPHFLETFAKAIVKNKKAKTFYACWQNFISKKIFNHKFNYNKLCEENFIDLGVFVHHKEVYQEFGGFDEKLTRLVDWELILRYTQKYEPVMLPHVVMSYNDTNDFKRITNSISLDNNMAYIKNKYCKKYSVSSGKSDYELIKQSKYFDSEYYLANNPDVKKVGVDPVKHYLKFGWKEKRTPSCNCDDIGYLERYKSVKAANINPLLHYEKYGKYQGFRIDVIKDYSFYERLPTSEYKKELALWFKEKTGKKLNLNNPQTYNEKIQWLKLYDSTPIKTRLADKYLVRDWIKEKIGEQYLIPLLGVYDNFDEIDFAKLPNQFVIKCNHGSGWNIIVKDKSKLDLKEVKEKLDEWMSTNFAFLCGLELHYRDIKPKIIIEKYIQELGDALYDYRFFCSNGKVIQIWLDVYSGTPYHQRKIYDKNWNELNIIVKWPRLEKEVEKPKNLEKMIQLSETLSENFALVRVDFYDVNNHIYFGEMTFTSMSGTGKFNPETEDLKLGNMIKLPKLAYDMDRKVYCKPEECYKPNKIDIKSILARPVIPDDRNLKLTIVVPIYNALSDVKNCLTSLLEANLLKQTKVILMDDCSNKETQNYLQKFANKHSNFKLCRNNQNLGFIKNCNKGIDLAKGDIVVLLNSDTKVPLGFDKRVLQCFKSDKNIALASPLSIHSGFFKIPENKKYQLPQIDKIVQKTSENKYPLITPEGFCYALRKEVTDKIGKLDEIFGMGYCEEDDLDMRALLHGYRTVLIDNLIVYHKSHASFSSEKREEILERNVIKFKRRWDVYQRFARFDMKMDETLSYYNNKYNKLIGNI